MTTTNHSDHALIAAAYLNSASELARQGGEWAGADGQLAHAQVLATIGLAEAVLAVAHELRDGVTTYPT
jgi:hypothetical protein